MSEAQQKLIRVSIREDEERVTSVLNSDEVHKDYWEYVALVIRIEERIISLTKEVGGPHWCDPNDVCFAIKSVIYEVPLTTLLSVNTIVYIASRNDNVGNSDNFMIYSDEKGDELFRILLTEESEESAKASVVFDFTTLNEKQKR